MIVTFPLLFLILIEFFRKSLSLEEKFPRINKFYLAIIFFYSIIFFLNLILLISWPNSEQLDLIQYPPDNLGPGLIKFHQFTIPFIILLLSSIVLAFISWRKGAGLLPIFVYLFYYLSNIANCSDCISYF